MADDRTTRLNAFVGSGRAMVEKGRPPVLRALGWGLVAAGVVLLAMAWAQGNVRVFLVLVVPVVVVEGPLGVLAVLAVVAGLVALFASAWAGAVGPAPPEHGQGDAGDRPGPTAEASRRRSGGVVLLGPLPIVWGSDERTVRRLAWLAVTLLVATVLAWWALSMQ